MADKKSVSNNLSNSQSHLFYIDYMGNMLSNLKLAFYESSDESGFFKKIMSGGNNSKQREILVRSYEIMQDLYDDMMAPYKWNQLGHIEQLNELDKARIKQLAV